MSARRSTVLPGAPPVTVASTPVRPTPVFTSRPSARSRPATKPEVRTSWNAVSGCACRSRRTPTRSSRSLAVKWLVSVFMRLSPGEPRGPGVRGPAGSVLARGVGGRSLALLEQPPPLGLLAQHVPVQHHELDAAVLRHVERAVVRHQRPALAIALGGVLLGLQVGEL